MGTAASCPIQTFAAPELQRQVLDSCSHSCDLATECCSALCGALHKADYVDPSIMESGGFTLPWKAHSQGGFQRCDDIMLNIISGVAKSPTAANSAVDVALELAQGTYCRCQGALFVVFTDCSDTRMTRNYVDHPCVAFLVLQRREGISGRQVHIIGWST